MSAASPLDAVAEVEPADAWCGDATSVVSF